MEKDKLLDAHAHWESKLQQAILQCIDKPCRWAIYASRPLTYWIYRNGVLLGEAVSLIQWCTRRHMRCRLNKGLQQVKQLKMLERIAGTVHLRRNLLTDGKFPIEVADQFGLQLLGVDVAKDHKTLPEVGEAIRKNWQWMWTTVLDDDVKEAVRRLEGGEEMPHARM